MTPVNALSLLREIPDLSPASQGPGTCFFWGAGRFDRRVTVGLPDVKGRAQILEVHIRLLAFTWRMGSQDSDT